MFQLMVINVHNKIFSRFVSILLDFSPLGDSPISGPLGPYNFSLQFSCNFEPLGDPHPESSTILLSVISVLSVRPLFLDL